VGMSVKELKRRFVRPSKQGKPVLLPDHSVVQTRDITWTAIRATADGAALTLKGLQEASPSSHGRAQSPWRGSLPGAVLLVQRRSDRGRGERNRTLHHQSAG